MSELNERTPKDYVEDLRCAYEQGDWRAQAQALVALVAAWEADRAALVAAVTPDELLIKAYRTGWVSALHLAATSTEWRTDEGILKLIKG
jgi:hypothetical protein